jgi:zinc-ribbon domain
MHCPRCGEQVEQGDRYCAECGAELRAPRTDAGQRPSLRDRVANVIGRDRRTRLLTAGTALAVVVAVAAFVALDTGDGGARSDPYTRAADQACVEAKQRLARTGRRAFDPEGGTSRARYAEELVRVVTELRFTLQGLDARAGHAGDAADLDVALREASVEIGALARVARTGGEQALGEQAARADGATERVEEAIEQAGLRECSRLALAASSPSDG